MKFYNIKDEYIRYLRQYDSKIAENKNQTRPYVGVVFKINDIKYYAPFSSPKPKHLKMKNSIDFRKINNGLYGAINFNNMIPVPDDALIPINIEKIPNNQYKRLLQNQYVSIRSVQAQIKKTAYNLHTIILTPNEKLASYEISVKQRCCNLSLLEKIYLDYESDFTPIKPESKKF